MGEPAVGAADASEAATTGRSRPRIGGPELFILAAWVGFLVRVWQLHDRVPSWWQDSADYAEVGAHPLLSTDLWTGSRPPLVSYLIAGLGGEPGTQYVWFQVLLAAICWGALAAQVAVGMPGRRRWIGWGAVLAFSLTTPITMWDRSVLSESLGISLMVLFVAVGIWLLRRPSWWRLGTMLVVALAWVLTRDTNIVVLASVALVLAGGWVVTGRRARGGASDREGEGTADEPAAGAATLVDGATVDEGGARPGRTWMLAGVLGLSVAVLLSMWSSSAGDRQLVPLRHVFAVRVLPYEDRLQWFADQGMPDVELFLPVPDVVDPERPPVIGVPEDDPAYDDWWQWLEDDGRSALILWAVTHPSYLVTEPLQDPERVFNNADGTVLGYAPADMRHVPLVSSLFWLPTIPTVAVAAAVAVWYRRRRWAVTPLVGVAGLCVLVSGPLAFIAWHADGMESARHLFFAAVLVRLGALLMVLSLLEVLPVAAPATTSAGEVPSGAGAADGGGTTGPDPAPPSDGAGADRPEPGVGAVAPGA